MLNGTQNIHKNKIAKYFNYPSTKVLTRKRYGIMMHVLVTNLLTAPICTNKAITGIVYRELAANFSSIDLDLQDLARSIKCNHYSYRNHTSSTDIL